ncbi:sugar ABC transporter ATP-binding protein [Cardiobacterium valvarum]|uniref:Ribose import ATP-binding protein RbsA n=1 Tax=Cardiobacterium valvarum TaxID=194702 RepID=A0A381DX40_9GAMM|nr:sugar ABC transporter ATP-binding protein [Cardiobacterium valvarum]SUX17755.1 Ribose import ATP-binding protein RbsA [Cardiobacterium valvarum]
MTAAAPALLNLRDISKSFTGVAALRGINLTIHAGQVHTLLGENGAGKSTLIKILAGVHQADSGTMLLDGTPYRPANPRQAAARGIAVVFQELSLCNNLTVAENILATREPARYGIINRKALYRRARELVQDLNLPIDVEARVADLSIAQRQLVEIAKGLSHDARVIILDEPTSSLSDAEAEILFAIIARLKAAGKAVIYISHRMEEIMRLSDAITVMRDGEYIATLPREKTTVDELIRLMVGRRMEQMYPPRLPQTPATDGVPPALEVQHFSHAHAFRDINFAVHPGEILGFFGLVGAGRSEVMNAIFGMLSASGTIRLDDETVHIKNPVEAIHYGIGFVTENRKEQGLVLSHPVRSNISMAALKRFAARLGFLRFAAEKQAAQGEVARLAIRTASLEAAAATLSGGNQQKIVLAKWLGTYPHVLILDEPTRGVDVGAKYEIYRIIRQLAAEGTAILLISSELPELTGLADRIIVMHEGTQSATLAQADFNPQTIMAAATGQLHVSPSP